MLRILWNSKSAMTADQEKLDAISNNLANSTTSGYKKETVSFQDLVSETLNRTGYPVTENSTRMKDPYTGSGVKTGSWIRDTTQGSLIKSDLNTNFAIDGEGYFQVTTADGQKAYTRNGEFIVDADGKLTDHDGDVLTIQYNNGYNANNVKFTNDNFTVAQDGTVSIKTANGTENVGKIPVYNAIGSESMTSIGDNLYKPAAGVNVFQTTNADLYQGYTEASNVDVATEMSDMIVTQRAFQLGSKGIQTADQMWQIANNLRSK